jgi:predicted HicB family RNase H-like nuclease
MSNKAMQRLKTVWGKAGRDQIPSPEEVKRTMGRPGPRAKSARTARVDLRVTPEEKHRLELTALREGVSLNELFARMLALYEREHGRPEITSTDAKERK